MCYSVNMLLCASRASKSPLDHLTGKWLSRLLWSRRQVHTLDPVFRILKLGPHSSGIASFSSCATQQFIQTYGNRSAILNTVLKMWWQEKSILFNALCVILTSFEDAFISRTWEYLSAKILKGSVRSVVWWANFPSRNGHCKGRLHCSVVDILAAQFPSL